MKISIWGICGKMGRILTKTILESNEFEILFGIDKKIENIGNITIYDEIYSGKEKPDVLIDFSNRTSTTKLLKLATLLKCPLVICSTGQTTEDLIEIYNASKQIPIMLTPNTSKGAAFLINSAKNGSKFFNGNEYKIDINESHSKQKKDIPSGTAISLLEAILSIHPSLKPIYCLENKEDHLKDEISVLSKRTENSICEHEISFYNNEEKLIIKHQAFDRKIFALGALECAKFIKGKPPGLYKMDDMMKIEKCYNCSCSKREITNQK